MPQTCTSRQHSSKDCGGSGSESELEEPPDQAYSIMNVQEDEVSITYEGNLGGI